MSDSEVYSTSDDTTAESFSERVRRESLSQAKQTELSAKRTAEYLLSAKPVDSGYIESRLAAVFMGKVWLIPSGKYHSYALAYFKSVGAEIKRVTIRVELETEV